MLPSLKASRQTAYIKNKCVGKAGRLISDIWSIGGYLVTVDIEKVFDSFDHGFLQDVFKKLGFVNNFIDWIKILLTNQESCVINAGSTTSYFKLENRARQDDPMSAYLFIIALGIIFAMLNSNPNVKDLNIFNYNYLYTV